MGASHIRRLPPELARKIAAGEVIERPASVVRELMENSIDSRPDAVGVSIDSGGMDAIRVMDDGCGIMAEDLEVIAQPHATSKISTEDDLLRVSTLGFRGEALSSMAAVADLEIVTATDDSGAHKFSARPGRESRIDPASGKRGTSVSVMRLFESFPARKRFLKRSATETQLVQQTFIDRALPHVSIEFRLTVDGKPRMYLPRSSLKARLLSAYSCDEPESFFHEAKGSTPDFSYAIVFGGPEVKRPDRRHLQCFVNGRRVQDFSLQKAMEIAYSGYLPGGIYPFAFLFLEIKPELIDFNIHPAKKEIRFRDPSAIHSGLIKALRSALVSVSGSPRSPDAESEPSETRREADFGFDIPGTSASQGIERNMRETGYADSRPGLDFLRAVAESRPSLTPGPLPHEGFKVLGQCMGVFILVESGDALFIVDQHAAHERALFDILESRPPRTQEMLVPYLFECEREEDEFLEANLDALAKAGYFFEREEPGRWALVGQPEGIKERIADVIHEIVSLRDSASTFSRSMNALTACRSAIKEGEVLDQMSMEELARTAFSLPEPKCPHGRPVWIRIGREELYRRILRIVE